MMNLFRYVLAIWLFFGAAFSGFSDEHIREAFAPSQEGTYLENVLRAMTHPETARFILEYPAYFGSDGEIDITEDVAGGGIPLFSQWDRRWGYRIYGSSFLAMTGCGPTCLSMVYCGLTGNTDWNPYAVARMAMDRGYYVPGVGTAWELMTSGAGSLGLNAWEVPIDEGAIAENLQSGYPLIASMRPGDFTKKGHFIVLAGLDGDGKVIVNDPNSAARSEKTWDVGRLVAQMKGLWAYSY